MGVPWCIYQLPSDGHFHYFHLSIISIISILVRMFVCTLAVLLWDRFLEAGLLDDLPLFGYIDNDQASEVSP